MYQEHDFGQTMVRENQDILYSLRKINPDYKMNSLLSEIGDIFSALTNTYQLEYGDFTAFLRFQKEQTANMLDQLWSQADSDIYNKFQNNELTLKEYDIWEHQLDKWYNAMLSAIKEFVKEERGQDFDPDLFKKTFIMAA